MTKRSPTPLSRTRRAWRKGLILWAAVTPLVSWAVCALLVFWILPPVTPSGKADAVVVLAGAPEERWPVAIRHVVDGVAPLLIVSAVDRSHQQLPVRPCQVPGAEGLDTRCFSPFPVNTRGEAISVADALTRGGWDAAVVVTSRYHAARTKVLISQCTDAKIEVVVSEPSLRLKEWIGAAIEETGGLLDAFLRPECKNAP